MKYLIQIFYILLFYALGEGVSLLIGQFVPGSVLGMMLLFLALRMRIIRPPKVDATSNFLTENMGIFFVPAGVGLITQIDLLKQYWAAIVISMIVSTAVVLWVVAFSQQRMENHSAKRHK
ncbi:murein hydrolase transporter LrgA [Porphyromonas crevioricanis]|uniref:Murein hydrolase transporter LrgA n=2 Tax=Porphyromonas crevioricanis TaxID=393921 RepID=A0AB34PGZ6_9PORP|nr:CidA/LrgA family protein [Porphyromonas crevioricanis]KGN90959.1 murein hydrolase transporter LrgA [Porphyromonas crevioricanis]KGN95055.1 murein hydrolase transporter LrgA [Porphyromonas crevioricanis]GAD06272.1 antiholin-like protein LrgA [Porphyromonas crevioricanis JCM 15906]SJZ54417.1 holin-like protein [Porphyromonas crevioricanis]